MAEAGVHHGVVVEVLPRQVFLVRLGDGREVRAGLTPRSKHALGPPIEGTPVSIKISTMDPNRGRIL